MVGQGGGKGNAVFLDIIFLFLQLYKGGFLRKKEEKWEGGEIIINCL